MPEVQDTIDRLAALEEEKAVLEQQLVEHPLLQQTFATVDAAIKGSSLMQALGAVAVESQAHPEWCNVDFPIDTASGVQALAIRFIIDAALANGAKPGFNLEPDGNRVGVPGRIYFPITKFEGALEAFQLASLTKADRDLYYQSIADEESA